MDLERTVEFSKPITGLGINLDAPENPLLSVYFEERPSMILVAGTGAPFDSEMRDLIFRGKPFGSERSLTVSDLLVQAEGTDIVVTSSSGTRRLVGHGTPVTTLGRFPSQGDPLLMSGSEDGSIRIWNLLTGELVRQSRPCRVSVLVAYTGADGHPRIASGGRTGELRIWNPRLPAPSRIEPVSIRGFSDRVATDDLLGRSRFAYALFQLLRPGDDGPTVMTVEGAWGSGKSTLLGFVQRTLATELNDVPRGRRLTVFGADRMLYRPPVREVTKKTPTKPLVATFNPWRHQSSEQVWAGLAKAVTAASEPALMPDQNAKERYWFANNAHRIDRRHLQRQLWKRIYSPLLTFAGLGFGLSLLGALTKLDLTWAFWPSVGVAGLGALHTVVRYLAGRASAFLPGELFAGPVASNAFSMATTDPLIRDPYYQAKAGYLYLVQHDVKALLEDLVDQGYQMVLLIDDLDRCMPRTTAQVFEAINVFLSDDFPAIRFVLGLDTSVVASHVDHAYKELADAKIVVHPDDPSPGWTFLRKLVQLPVRLPRTTEDHVDQILLDQLGPVHNDKVGMAPVQKAASTAAPPVSMVSEQLVIAIERHPQLREHLRRRLMAQPERSVREEKRLLNLWQFYLRVLGSDVEQACQLVAVAEIAVRWPAYLHRLRGGWLDLADAIDDDVRWGAAIARLGYVHGDRKAAANLRELLRDCDARAVAVLANRLF
jgi:hypothetical protein